MGISRSGISRFGISRDGISTPRISPVRYPNGAIVYYDFTKNTPVESILEQVERDASLLTLRASNSNPTQLNGSVTTVGTNTAALVTGDGVLIQGPATNLSTDDPVDATAWAKSGAANPVSTTEPSPFPGVNYTKVEMTASTDFNFVNTFFAVVSGQTYTQTYAVKKQPTRFMQIALSTRFPAGDFYNINLLTGAVGNSVSTVSGIKVIDGGDYWFIICTGTANLTGINSRIWLSLLLTDINSRLSFQLLYS